MNNKDNDGCYYWLRYMMCGMSIVCLIVMITTGSLYISYDTLAAKHNTNILTDYKKYDNFSITTFTQENNTCDVCVLFSPRVCYQYNKVRCDNFNIMYNNDNDDKNDIFECHIFYNNVRDPESVLRNIINEM